MKINQFILIDCCFDSIGSLGKYPGEKDVTGLIIRDSTITGTMNGVRIKSWANSPSPSKVSNITFDNIVLKDVSNPIIIDQLYCPSGRCPNQVRLDGDHPRDLSLFLSIWDWFEE